MTSLGLAARIPGAVFDERGLALVLCGFAPVLGDLVLGGFAPVLGDLVLSALTLGSTFTGGFLGPARAFTGGFLGPARAFAGGFLGPARAFAGGFLGPT